VGAALVWLPVAIYFFLAGEVWQGVALVAWGVLVVGLVDNVLRPVLVGKDVLRGVAHLHRGAEPAHDLEP